MSNVGNEARVSVSFLHSCFGPALDLCSVTKNILGGAVWVLEQFIYYCPPSQDMKGRSLLRPEKHCLLADEIDTRLLSHDTVISE